MNGMCNASAIGFGSLHFRIDKLSCALRKLLILIALLGWSRTGAQSLYSFDAPPSDGSSTGLAGPNGTVEHAHHRTAVLVDGPSLRLLPAGTFVTRIGFVLSRAAGTRVNGNLTIYLSNTPTTTRDVNMVWSGIIAGMSRVYAGPFTVPDTTGSVNVTLSTPFQYGGRSMYAAYEFESSGPFTTQNAVFASNITMSISARTGFSATEPLSVLSDLSDFRPVLRFGFPLPAVQWNSTSVAAQADLTGLDIVDDASAWVCTTSGSASRTTDLGITWIDAGSIPDSASTILGLTSSAALAISGRESEISSLNLTSDGGVSWSKVTDSDLTVRVAVAGKTSATSLWCLGGTANDSVALLTSFDQGRSWTRSQTGVALEPGVSVSRGSGFRMGNVVWFGTRGSGAASGRVYRSSTGPAGPWQYHSTGRANVAAIAFGSATGTGIAGHAGCNDTISRSTDGGFTWSSVAVPGLGEVSSLQYFAGGQDAWAATSTGIWWTSDGGLTWQRSFASGSRSLACIRFFPNFQSALAIGSGGLMVRGAWVKTPLVDVSRSSVIPDEYRLEANYPNPFNSSTWMEYALPVASFVNLKLIDVLGREIVTLVSGEKNAGRFRVQWNAGQSPSGVYFCRMLVRPSSGGRMNQYIKTQKLVLLK